VFSLAPMGAGDAGWAGVGANGGGGSGGDEGQKGESSNPAGMTGVAPATGGSSARNGMRMAHKSVASDVHLQQFIAYHVYFSLCWWSGRADVARHVIGCHPTRDTRVYNSSHSRGRQWAWQLPVLLAKS
jgi:hypothetical protein